MRVLSRLGKTHIEDRLTTARMFWSVCLFLTTCVSANSRPSQEERWNVPPPPKAVALVTQAEDLAERNDFNKALASARQAVAVAPAYLKAHLEYIRVSVNFLGQFDRVKAEYDSLILSEPNNPVYLFASAVSGLRGNDPRNDLEKVAQIAPAWAWSYYARGALAQESEYESALVEYSRCIQKDGTADRAYYKVISIQAQRLNHIDDAIKTAELMAAQPELHLQGLMELWRLRFLRAQGDADLVLKLKAELKQLASGSTELHVLVALYRTFTNVIKDGEESRSIEARIHNVDPSWYPERGMTALAMPFNESGLPHIMTLANRQLVIFNSANSIKEDLDPKERIVRLEHLLSLKPNPDLRWYLTSQLYQAARKLTDQAKILKYGESLYAMDRSDTSLLANMALLLAVRQRDWRSALRFARLAEKGTAQFHPTPKPSNISTEDFEGIFPKKWRLANYQRQRARALESLGWILCQMDDCKGGEIKLREAVSLDRTEQGLTLLAKILLKLDQLDEAARVSVEAKNEFYNLIKSRFENEPSQDFRLVTIDGRKVALSDLKGKVVMLSFWATWCGPCAAESPVIKNIYDKYKQQGFEVLGISVDGKETRDQVREFVREHKINYPILLDDGVSTLYGVIIYPTVILIDRRGNLRYTAKGYGVDTPRELELVAAELMEDQR